MEWTKPLSMVMIALVALLIVVSAVELFRTTLAAEATLLASAITLTVVGLLVLGAVAVGARNRQWLQNPDSYW